MKSIYVLGSDGQLGQCLRSLEPKWNYLTKQDLDLSKTDDIKKYFGKLTISDVVINLAAYTQVDKAESEYDLAMRVNAHASRELASVCQTYFYISTDYVFSGGYTPYTEDAPTNPPNVYGKSKLLGEQWAQGVNSNTYIIRTSWLYSEYGVNFVKKILELAKTKSELKIIDDQIGSPTYAVDLAQIIRQMVLKQNEVPPGVYHYAGSGECSWYEFTKEIFKIKNISTALKAIPSSEFPQAAKRPKYSVLSTAKIQRTLNIEIPTWQQALKLCLARR